jgi:hypothetical protein
MDALQLEGSERFGGVGELKNEERSRIVHALFRTFLAGKAHGYCVVSCEFCTGKAAFRAERESWLTVGEYLS